MKSLTILLIIIAIESVGFAESSSRHTWRYGQDVCSGPWEYKRYNTCKDKSKIIKKVQVLTEEQYSDVIRYAEPSVGNSSNTFSDRHPEFLESYDEIVNEDCPISGNARKPRFCTHHSFPTIGLTTVVDSATKDVRIDSENKSEAEVSVKEQCDEFANELLESLPQPKLESSLPPQTSKDGLEGQSYERSFSHYLVPSISIKYRGSRLYKRCIDRDMNFFGDVNCRKYKYYSAGTCTVSIQKARHEAKADEEKCGSVPYESIPSETCSYALTYERSPRSDCQNQTSGYGPNSDLYFSEIFTNKNNIIGKDSSAHGFRCTTAEDIEINPQSGEGTEKKYRVLVKSLFDAIDNKIPPGNTDIVIDKAVSYLRSLSSFSQATANKIHEILEPNYCADYQCSTAGELIHILVRRKFPTAAFISSEKSDMIGFDDPLFSLGLVSVSEDSEFTPKLSTPIGVEGVFFCLSDRCTPDNRIPMVVNKRSNSTISFSSSRSFNSNEVGQITFDVQLRNHTISKSMVLDEETVEELISHEQRELIYVFDHGTLQEPTKTRMKVLDARTGALYKDLGVVKNDGGIGRDMPIVAQSRDGKKVAVYAEKEIKIFQMPGMEYQAKKIVPYDNIGGMYFSESDVLMVIKGKDIVNSERWEVEYSLPFYPRTISANGLLIANRGGDDDYTVGDAGIHYYNVVTGTDTFISTANPSGDDSGTGRGTFNAVFSSDNKTLLVTHTDWYRNKVIDISTGEIIDNPMGNVITIIDDLKISYGDYGDNEIEFIDIETDEVRYSLPKTAGVINKIDVARNMRTVMIEKLIQTEPAVGIGLPQNQRWLQIWDLESKNLIHAFEVTGRRGSDVGFIYSATGLE